MANAPISLYRTAATEVPVGGAPVVAIYGPVAGGIVVNPPGATESLFVSLVGDATLAASLTTSELAPGQTFVVPAGFTGRVSVNAVTGGHAFSGYVLQPPSVPATPQKGNFPPAGPTSYAKTIPAYLYKQYDDDEDLQAFVAAYNAMAQQYVDWFNQVNLPIYTGLSGDLLNWVALGLYGMSRPALQSGLNLDEGTFNTYEFNTLAYNARKNVGPANITSTSDDVFKRIMTWNFYKGDGNVMTVRWLKRRILRFMTGQDGSAPNIDQTYIVSVTFGAGGLCTIRIAQGSRTILGGSLYNAAAFNTRSAIFNSLLTRFVPGPNPLPNQNVLKQAIQSGVLQLPFQYEFSVAA